MPNICVRRLAGQYVFIWVGIPYWEAVLTVNQVPLAHLVRIQGGPPASCERIRLKTLIKNNILYQFGICLSRLLVPIGISDLFPKHTGVAQLAEQQIDNL